MRILEEERLVKYISPSELLRKYDNSMTKSVIDDLTNPSFLKLCQQQGLPRLWKVYAEKVPSALADASFRKYLVNIPNFYDGQFLVHAFRETGPYERREHSLYERMAERSTERTHRYGEIRMVELPFEVGESLMINHALCACDEFSLTPITDHKFHNDALMFKFRRMQDTRLVKKLLVDYDFIKDMKTDLTSIEVISDTVPMLYRANMTDVLEFRDENKDALERFRVEMRKIVTEVEENCWDEDFRKRIIEIVDSNVNPSIQNIKDSVESIKDKFLRILKKGAEISPLPIFASLVPGCNPTIALVASAGVVALDEYLEASKKSQKRRKNSFAYLFEAQKRFSV